MHELSLAESVVQLIEDSAKRDGFQRVTAVWLEIGELAAVEVDSLRFCFDAVTRDTVAAGARLEIIPVAGRAWCANCRQTVTVHDRIDACPQCGEFELSVSDGTQMRVKELEVV